MRQTTQAIVAALPLFVAAGSAQADLFDRGNGLIYDSTFNITWLQNASPAAGSVFDDGWSSTDGRMSFANAQAWAASFTYTVGNVTFSDWRLPQGVDLGAPGAVLDGLTIPTPPFSGPGCDWQFNGYDCGVNMAPLSSELVHLFYVDLGNLASYDTDANPRSGVSGVDFGLVNSGPFTNFQNYIYWSEIVNPVDPTQQWRHFKPYDGRMSWRLEEDPDYVAWAVADGDIASSLVVSHAPEPETYAMLLAGLGVLGFVTRRKKQTTS